MHVMVKLIVACLVLSLIGCSSNPHFNKYEMAKDVDNHVEIIADKKRLFEHMSKGDDFKYVIHVDKPYFSAFSAASLKPLSFLESNGFISMSKSEVSESNIFKYLFSNFNGQVKLESGVFDEDLKVKGNLNFQGTKKGVLDYLCHVINCSWTYDKLNGLSLSKFQTKTWEVNFMPLSYEMRANLQSTTASGAAGGGATNGASGNGGQNIAVSHKSLNLFDELKQSIDNIKSKDGSFTLNQAMGLLIVKDKPAVIDRVDKIVSSLRVLSSDIAIYVDVFQVNTSDTTELGVELDAIYNSVSDGVTWGTQVRSIVNTNSDNIGGNVTDEASRFFNTSALIKAMKEKLNVVRHVQKTTIAKNRKVSVLSSLSNFPYEEIESNIVQNTGIINTSTIREKPVGTNITVLPVITSNNKISMQLNYFNSEVIGEFKRVSLGGGGTTTFPLTSDAKNMLEFTLTDGRPLIVAGETNSSMKNNSRSLSIAKSNDYNALVLVVTAKIIK